MLPVFAEIVGSSKSLLVFAEIINSWKVLACFTEIVVESDYMSLLK